MPSTAAAYKAKFQATGIQSDGFWSVPVPDGTVVWLLCDNLKTGEPVRANAWVYQNGETFTYQRDPAPFNMGLSDYGFNDWPLAGWATDNVLHVLSDRHNPQPGSFPTFDGLTLQSFYLPSLEVIERRKFCPVPPLPGAEESHWTSWSGGLYDDGTDIWIYGCVHKPVGATPANKQHHVARCPRNSLADTFKWEYEGPVPLTSSAASLGIYDSGKAIVKGSLEKVQRWTGSDPLFTGLQKDPVPEIVIPVGTTYAAHAHPWLPPLTSGKMLVTVNVNNPGDYFPRFYEINQ